MLTYLIRESVISERISSVSSGIITRSLIQSLLAALVLGMMFAFIIHQNRKNAKLELEKETTEAENRARSEEMEQRLALQEELLEQKTQQQEQSKLITALASDFRSVYYLELDRNRGVCYQARTDLHGFSTGDEFNYLESVTAYCNKYILDPGGRAFFQDPRDRDDLGQGIRSGKPEYRSGRLYHEALSDAESDPGAGAAHHRTE